MERLPEDIAWDEERFVAALENVAGSEAGVLWKACIHPNVRLLSQQGGKVVWAHTLLAEFLRAKALAEFWKQRSRDVQLRLNQTPPRTILLASLLPAEEGPGLWNWLGQQADTSPRRWAEVAALCLGERDDAPASLAQQIIQGWLRAFRSGVPEVHWDRAIQATTRFFPSVTFAQALTLLDSSSSSDQRAGGAILRLVGQVTALPDNLIETLVQTAMKDRYGSLNPDVVVVFAAEAQEHYQQLIFQKLIDALSAQDVAVRHNAVEILADLRHLATPQQHDEINSRLRHIAQQDPASSVRRAAIQALARL